jgi:GH15 family glucan-1,4-alpha-glucosidase
MNAASKIQDHAIIGDGRSAALVARDGTIDWLCWPRFDSPSLFGRLLDRNVGGSWRIAPVEPARFQRRYLDETNVLQTQCHTNRGTVSLTDFMPAATEEQKRTMLWPEHEIVRQIECEQGGGNRSRFRSATGLRAGKRSVARHWTLRTAIGN